MQRSGTSTTSSTAERPTSPFFYLTLSGLDVVGGNPAFRVTESQLRALKQPSSDAVVSARLALIRELHTAPKGPIAGGSVLHDAWMACLNKEGCALACFLFGGPPDSSRREAIDWLVRARCPVLTYDSLRLLANECIDSPPRRPLDLRAAFDGYVTDVHPSAVPEEKCVDVCASPVSERAPTPVVSVHAPSPVDGELSAVLAPVVGASLLGADAV